MSSLSHSPDEPTSLKRHLASTFPRHRTRTVSAEVNPGSNVTNICFNSTLISLVGDSQLTGCIQNWITIPLDQKITKRKRSPEPTRGSRRAQFLESRRVKPAVSARFAVITADRPAGSALPLEPIVYTLPVEITRTNSMYSPARVHQLPLTLTKEFQRAWQSSRSFGHSYANR